MIISRRPTDRVQTSEYFRDFLREDVDLEDSFDSSPRSLKSIRTSPRLLPMLSQRFSEASSGFFLIGLDMVKPDFYLDLTCNPNPVLTSTRRPLIIPRLVPNIVLQISKVGLIFSASCLYWCNCLL